MMEPVFDSKVRAEKYAQVLEDLLQDEGWRTEIERDQPHYIAVVARVPGLLRGGRARTTRTTGWWHWARVYVADHDRIGVAGVAAHDVAAVLQRKLGGKPFVKDRFGMLVRRDHPWNGAAVSVWWRGVRAQ
jgi:hypothetical protein